MADPTNPLSQSLVDDYMAARRKRLEEEAAGTAQPYSSPPPPAAPNLDAPDVVGARNRLRGYVLERARAEHGDATPKALEYAREKMAPYEVPGPTPEKPTPYEQVLLALTGQVIHEDNRPVSVADRERALAHQALRGVLSPVEVPVKGAAAAVGVPLTGSLADKAVPGVRSVVPGAEQVTSDTTSADPGWRGPARMAQAISDPKPKSDLQGLAAENEALAAMRILGTAVSSVVIEGVERLPVAADWRKLAETGELDMVQVGDVLGASPGHNQRVRRDTFEWSGPTPLGFEVPVVGADMLQGVLERIERGDGLEVDVARAAETKIGPEARDAGWYAGFALDVFTNWEGMLGYGPKAAAALAKRAKLAQEMGLAPNRMSAMLAAIPNSTVDLGEMGARAAAEGVETGAKSVDDLEEGLRPYLDEAAAIRQGLTPGEVAANDGLRATQRVDEDFVGAKQAEREAAEAGATRARTVFEQVTEEHGALNQRVVDATRADDEAHARALQEFEAQKARGDELDQTATQRERDLASAQRDLGKLEERAKVAEQRAGDLAAWEARRVAREEAVAAYKKAQKQDTTHAKTQQERAQVTEELQKLETERQGYEATYRTALQDLSKAMNEPLPGRAERVDSTGTTVHLNKSSPHKNNVPPEVKHLLSTLLTNQLTPDVVYQQLDTIAAKLSQSERAYLKGKVKALLDPALEHIRVVQAMQTAGARIGELDKVLAKPPKGPPPPPPAPDPKPAALRTAGPTPDDLAAARNRVSQLEAEVADVRAALVAHQRPTKPVRAPSPERQKLTDELAVVERRRRMAENEMATAARRANEAQLRSGDASALAKLEEERLGTVDITSRPGSTYVIRNKFGDVAPNGMSHDLDDALSRFADTRHQDGDVLWRDNDRPVAVWRSTGEGKAVLVPLHDLAVEEASSIKRIAASVGEVELRRAVDPDARAAGNALVELMTPMRRYVPQTETGRMIQDAYRMWARDKLGADELKALPTGALVTHRDYRAIMGRVNGQLDEAFGVRGEAMAPILGGKVTLDEARQAAVAALAQKWGLSGLDPSDIDAPTFRELLHAGVRHEGGTLAHVRSRVQGTKGMADLLQQHLALLTSDRVKANAITAKIRQSKVLTWAADKLVKYLLEDKFAGLPDHVRLTWKELRIRLERDPHLFLQEAERVVKQHRLKQGLGFHRPLDMAPVFQDLLPAYEKVTVQELDLARRILDEDAWSPGRVDDLHAEVLAPYGEPPTYLRAETEEVKRWALDKWAKERMDEADRWALEYLQVQVAAMGGKVNATLADRTLRSFEPAKRIAVYRELFVDGIHLGPKAREILGSVMTGTPDPGLSLGMFILAIRRDQIVGQAVDRLLEQGAALRVDEAAIMMHANGRGVLQDMALDRHRTWNPTAKRWEYHYPAGAIAWGERSLRMMGVEPGALSLAGRSTAVLDEVALGSTRVMVPRELAAELQAIMGSGRLTPAQVNVLDEALRIWKMSALGGLIIPRPRYFVGQAMALWPTVYSELGASGVAGVGKQAITNAPMVGELMMRLNTGSPLFRSRDPRAWLLRTASGEWYSIDELEALARRWGLEDTIYSFEVGQQFKELVGREQGSFRAITAPIGWWQDKIAAVGGAADQSMRLSIFLDQLQKGAPPAKAAETARRAVLDFRDLTETEAANFRKVFTFYAFMRKNADQFVRAILRHPHTITAQMRLAHYAATRDRDKVELGLLKAKDVSRLRVWTDEGPVVDAAGRLSPQYRAISWSSMPLGVGEQVNGIRLFVEPGGDQVGSINPFIVFGTLLATSKWLEAPTSPKRNRVPPVMFDFLAGGTLLERWGVGPVAIDGLEDELVADADASAVLHTPAVWMVGATILDDKERARAQAEYQAFLQLVGPTDANVEQVWRAIGWSEPGVPLTQQQEALSWVTGLRPMPVPLASEAQRRALQGRVREMDAAGRNVKPNVKQ